MNALLDSNILIYASQPTGGQARDFIRNNTALLHNLTLATHNTSDFSWISGLKLFDPV